MVYINQMIKIIDDLGKERPVFHSEKDFQHALAWKIHETLKKDPKFRIRLEKRLPKGDRRHVDITLSIEDMTIFIELKYKTKKSIIDYKEEEFILTNHKAQTDNKALFKKDVERIKEAVEDTENSIGYAIMLTNEPSYWKSLEGNWAVYSKPTRKNGEKDEFRYILVEVPIK